MFRSECDYTIFYRELAATIDIPPQQAELTLGAIQDAFYRPVCILFTYIFIILVDLTME